jgi:hypothetical protein
VLNKVRREQFVEGREVPVVDQLVDEPSEHVDVFLRGHYIVLSFNRV